MGEKRDEVRVRGVGGARWSVDDRVWIGRDGVFDDGDGGVVVVVGDSIGAGALRVVREVGGGVGGAFSSSWVDVRERLEGPAIVGRG